MLYSCNTTGPCEVQGGRCTRTDVECGPTLIFAGYDPMCGGNDKCCLPTKADAGTSCSMQLGSCFDAGTPCRSETKAVANACARSGEVCCVPISVACLKKNGKCQTLDLPCPNGQQPIGFEELCSPGNQCCGS